MFQFGCAFFNFCNASLNPGYAVSSIDVKFCIFLFIFIITLTSIKLPQSLTSIENCAFIETNSLEQIILPKNVVLGNSVFGAHHSNFKIYFEGNDVPASWKNVDWSHGINAPVSDHFFLYSETEPTGTSTYSYWHYDANNNPVLW